MWLISANIAINKDLRGKDNEENMDNKPDAAGSMVFIDATKQAAA